MRNRKKSSFIIIQNETEKCIQLIHIIKFQNFAIIIYVCRLVQVLS